MALTLPYTDLSGVVDDTKLEANFAAIAAKFGSIDNTDMSASAGMAVSKLAASNYEIVLGLTLAGSATANEGLNAATTAYHIVGTIPYDTTNTTYTISAIETFTYAAAARTAAVYTLKYGTAAQFIAGTETSIKAAISTGAGAATFTGTALSSFTTSVTTSSAAPSFFVLDVTTQGVSWVETDSFNISIKLQKALRT